MAKNTSSRTPKSPVAAEADHLTITVPAALAELERGLTSPAPKTAPVELAAAIAKFKAAETAEPKPETAELSVWGPRIAEPKPAANQPKRNYAPGASVASASVIASVAPNPKKPGSAAHARYAALAAYIAANGATSANVAIKATGYTRPDLLWDTQRGYITFA